MCNANLMQQRNFIDIFLARLLDHHTKHPQPTQRLHYTYNPQHLKPLPLTSATHTPPTTRWAQTSSPHTNRPVQYSIDRTDKHVYNTAYSHYTHTSYFLILYSAENHMLKLNI